MSTTYRVIGLLNAKLTKSSGGGTPTIVEVNIPVVNDITPNPGSGTITWEGDDEKFSYQSLDSLKFDIKADALDWAILQLLHQTAVTTGLPSDEASRIYMGSNTDGTTPVGLRAILRCLDHATNAEVKLRMEVFLGKIDQIGKSIDNLKNKGKAGLMFTLEAKKTTVDLINVALPGTVPADGVFYSLAKMT